MRFFKSPSAFELVWFDGHEPLVEPVTGRATGQSLLVLITNDEICQWQHQPSLVFWQSWTWRRALNRRARDQQSAQQSNRYYAMPIRDRWHGQRVYLQQLWEPHRENLSLDNAIPTRLQSQLELSQGLYSFNQWWQLWWFKGRLGSTINIESAEKLQVIHLQLSPILWVQVAHYQQQACWWRPINVREGVDWSYEYQRFVDFLSQQPLLKATKPSCLIWVNPSHYFVTPKPEEIGSGWSAEIIFPEQSQWQLHESAFDSQPVLRSLARQQPAYAVQPWYQYYGLQKRQAQLNQINAWLLCLVLLLAATLPLWVSTPNQISDVRLDTPPLNHQQQQVLSTQLDDFRRHYLAHKDHEVNRYAEQVWQWLNDRGMVVSHLEWRWQTPGYWQWQVQAELPLSERQELPNIMAGLAIDWASYGQIEQWQVDVSGIEPTVGRILNPQHQRIHVNWQWQLWPK